MSVPRILASVGLGAYAAFLVVALLSPPSGTQSAGAGHLATLAPALGVSPLRATQARAEMVADVLLLTPLSAPGSLVWLRSGLLGALTAAVPRWTLRLGRRVDGPR